MDAGWERLTGAEKRVVALTCEGLTNPQIAERLSISPRTVQRHLYEVFRKVGVSSRTQLAAQAMRQAQSDAPPGLGHIKSKDEPFDPQVSPPARQNKDSNREWGHG